MKYAIAWIATTIVACTAIFVSANAAWSLIMLIPGFISMTIGLVEYDTATRTTQEKERHESV